MRLIKVGNKKTAGEFLDVPRIIYKNDPNWICPPDNIINSIFNPRKNSYYKEGDAIRWILKDSEGKLIGRVAAFYDEKRAHKYSPPTGGMGFFECINDQNTANILFSACQEWLENNGMGAMDGPVNFGENDAYWGLLVEGFTPPAFGMNYHPPYYKDLFETFGFRPFFEQESKHLDLTKPVPERFWKIAEWVIRKPGYTFLHFKKNQIDKFAQDIVEIYNTAWIYHEHFAPLTIEKVRKSFEEAKNIIVEEFIWFVYHENKPIALFVMLPDMNQVFRLFNGKMTLWNQLRFLFLKSGKLVNRARVTIMGVIPKFQGIGIESAIFWHLKDPIFKKRTHYTEIEISWVGDFNPKMKATLDALGANFGKKHITYRKLFNKEIKYHRAQSIPEVKGEFFYNKK
ncbi:MAG: hypothetical protein JW731_14240 [Bacteroidales bacterium]|nr:hypothetical protein [Bacteroidales bacterium]